MVLALEIGVSVVRPADKEYRSYLCPVKGTQTPTISKVHCIFSWCVFTVYMLFSWVGNHVHVPQCTCGGQRATLGVGPPRPPCLRQGLLQGWLSLELPDILLSQPLLSPQECWYLQM